MAVDGVSAGLAGVVGVGFGVGVVVGDFVVVVGSVSNSKGLGLLAPELAGNHGADRTEQRLR